jgi:sulfatase modifying factor 1
MMLSLEKFRLGDLREPAIARPFCVSAFAVYILTGNLDEPVLRDSPAHDLHFRSVLKGGWWAAGRSRCRAATTAHSDSYRGPQIGARCCEDAHPKLAR